MAIESGAIVEAGPPAGPDELLRLMRIATHLNAGAMISLCLWLAWAAADPTRQIDGGMQVGGCECRWTRNSGPL